MLVSEGQKDFKFRLGQETESAYLCKLPVVQIGDSAHSFLPASSNGATQAIEDAVSLAECLRIGGKDAIPQSVRIHVRFRLVGCLRRHVHC